MSPARRAGILRQLSVVMISSLTTFSSGFVVGFSSPVIPQLEGDLLHGEQLSWFGSLTTLAGIPSAIVCGLCADYVGRKNAMLLICLPYTMGWMMLTSATNHMMLYAGRVLTGFGMSMALPIVSVYIAEVVDKDTRGYFCPLMIIIFVFGTVCSNGFGLVVTWRWLSVIGQAISSITVVLLLWIPESPRYLLYHGNREEADKVLSWLKTAPDVRDDDMADIRNIQSSNQQTIRLSDVRSPTFYKPLATMLLLTFFRDGTGAMAVAFYADTLFRNIGFDGNPGVPALLLSVVRLIGVCMTPLFAEKAGRRHLLIIPGILVAIGCIGVGVHFYVFIHYGWKSNWLPLLSLTIYSVNHAVGWGSIP